MKPIPADEVEAYFREKTSTQKPVATNRRPDLTSRPLCFIVVREYLIAYAPDEKPFVGDRRNADDAILG